MPLPTFIRCNDLEAAASPRAARSLSTSSKNRDFLKAGCSVRMSGHGPRMRLPSGSTLRPTAHADPEKYRALGQASVAARKGKSPKAAKAAERDGKAA